METRCSHVQKYRFERSTFEKISCSGPDRELLTSLAYNKNDKEFSFKIYFIKEQKRFIICSIIIFTYELTNRKQTHTKKRSMYPSLPLFFDWRWFTNINSFKSDTSDFNTFQLTSRNASDSISLGIHINSHIAALCPYNVNRSVAQVFQGLPRVQRRAVCMYAYMLVWVKLLSESWKI